MKKWKRSAIVVGMAVAFILATSSVVLADNGEGEAAAGLGGGGLMSTTTTSAPTTTIGGIIMTIVMVTGDSGSEAQLETYMRDNSVALQHDLYMGGGEAAEDLAQFFNVPEGQLDTFAQILYDNRQDLAPLAEPGQVNTDAASQFGQIVIDGMLNNDTLASNIVLDFG